MSPLQVCILDMNKTLGEAAQSDLSEKFGDKNVYFFVCDVTKTSDIEGMQNIREMSMYVQLPWPFSLSFYFSFYIFCRPLKKCKFEITDPEKVLIKINAIQH